jgi:hypothetical protein
MNITVFTWVKNEADIVPFFLRHYSFADKIIAWDNESTDDTRSILKSDSRVEVRDWVTGGMNDFELAQMKSEAYRDTGEGWKIVVDVDEFLWHPDIRALLNEYDAKGITVPGVKGRSMVSKEMPVNDGKSLLTDLVKDGIPDPWYSKFCIFRECVQVEYHLGAHQLKSITGRIVKAEKKDFLLLHFKHLSLERVIRKAKNFTLSEANIKAGIAYDNWNPVLMAERWNRDWNNKGKVIP